MPDQPASASGAEAKAEAERVATKGPIMLTLRVFKTRIKAKEESLWYQVEIKNVGQNKLAIDEPAFLTPASLGGGGGVGISLMVVGPNGKKLDLSPQMPDDSEVLMPGSNTWPIAADDKRDEATKRSVVATMFADRDILRRREERVAELEKKGASDAEIVRKSLRFDEEHPQSDAPTAPKPRPYFWLEPGKTASTIPWVYLGIHRDRRAIAPFSEFHGYEYEKPGIYRIRAIFDRRPSGWTVEYDKKHNVSENEDRILVETGTIEFEVVP